jgi:hypothetical protein
MKRLILTSPSGLTIDQLTVEQQAAIQSVFAQYVLPMPGTITTGTSTYSITRPDPESTEEVPLPDVTTTFTGTCILDAVTNDNFDPAVIEPLGLPFVLLGMWQWDGSEHSALINLLPLAPEFINYLPDVTTYDAEGNVISTNPPTLTIPHNWCGWGDVVL